MDRITAQKFADVYGIEKIKQIIADCPQNCDVYREWSFPKPYQGEMEKDQVYHYPLIDIRALFDSVRWTGSERDRSIMKKGLLHLSKESAIAHAEALIRLSGGNYE